MARLHRSLLGFTLIELLVTLAIVAVLAGAALPMAEVTVKRSKEQQLHGALQEIRSALDAYKQAVQEGRIALKAGESGYPPSLEALVLGIDDNKSQNGGKLYFLRRIPRDPMVQDSTQKASATWGMRSYASGPDSPKAGDDVFDVYSTSTEIGLNGVPYREW